MVRETGREAGREAGSAPAQARPGRGGSEVADMRSHQITVNTRTRPQSEQESEPGDENRDGSSSSDIAAVMFNHQHHQDLGG